MRHLRIRREAIRVLWVMVSAASVRAGAAPRQWWVAEEWPAAVRYLRSRLAALIAALALVFALEAANLSNASLAKLTTMLASQPTMAPSQPPIEYPTTALTMHRVIDEII
jgi:hypothetical protein